MSGLPETLAPETVAAILDLLPRPAPAPRVDDSALRLLALGLADAPTRLACARALLDAPETGIRLARIHASLNAELGGAAPQGGDLADLGRLAQLGGTFYDEDAALAFPHRFADPAVLDRLEERGWLERARDRSRARGLAPQVRHLAPTLPDTPEDRAWVVRCVAAAIDVAHRIGRELAEGLGHEATARLERALPALQLAWTQAGPAGLYDEVETLARALVLPIMDLARYDAMQDLIGAGYRASAALERPRLRSWLLSLEGAAAGKQGDDDRARALWGERVALNRRIGNPVGESDALLDLAAMALDAGNHAQFEELMEEVTEPLTAARRPDHWACAWSLRAKAALRQGDLEPALAAAERALEELRGTDGPDTAINVRRAVARVLAEAGRPWAAADALTEVLAFSIESGKSIITGNVLLDLGDVARRVGRPDLAFRSLGVAITIYRSTGSPNAALAEPRLEALRQAHPDLREAEEIGSWQAEAVAILDDLAFLRAIALAS